jgi:hypothetical protein
VLEKREIQYKEKERADHTDGPERWKKMNDETRF